MKLTGKLFLLWLAFMAALPATVLANNFEDTYNDLYFTVTPRERGLVHLKIMYLDVVFGSNNYCKDGKCTMKINGTEYEIARIEYSNDEDDDDEEADVYITGPKSDVGMLVLGSLKTETTDTYNDKEVKGKVMPNSRKEYTVKKVKDSGASCLEFDFYYDARFAGSVASFYMNIEVGNDDDVKDREMSGSPISFQDKPNIFFSDAIFVPMGTDRGYYSVMASNTTGVPLEVGSVIETGATAEGNIDITKDCKASPDGFSILIPSVSYTREVMVMAKIPYSPYIYYNMEPKVITLNALHNPKDFRLALKTGKKASSVLTWTVPNADQEDALPSDMIAIERQLYNTEDSTDAWTSIAQLPLERGKSSYEYIDSTAGCYGDSVYRSVRYRIYRLAIGKVDGYTSTVDAPNKRNGVVLGFLRTVDMCDLGDGRVRLNWAPVDFYDTGELGFMPDGWQLKLRRTANYMKGGMEVSTITETDITDKFYTNQEVTFSATAPNGRTVTVACSEYIDEGFAPCTTYSYELIYYPNDPAGVVQYMQRPFLNSSGQKNVVEPARDESRFTHFEVSDNTLQDRIHVQWAFDMQRLSSLVLERRLQGQGWRQLNIDPHLRYYDDYDVEAGQDVSYRLTASYECRDGMHSITTDEQHGKRRASGVVAGFVTFLDGTGIKDVTVELRHGGNVVATCVTDQTGAYRFPDVAYSDQAYVLTLNTTLADVSPRQIAVNIDKNQTFGYERNFVSSSSFDVDGYVYFERTTVPVYGATFFVDGEPVIDKTGQPVVSDNDGHFAFKVKQGARRLEVRKQGHTFMFGGLYADNQGQAIEITEPRIGIFFWDQTRVRTIGRVVGGRDQGEKPLGFGLSANNLGENLRIVLELEGNQRSWLVKDQLNDALTTTTDSMPHTQTKDHYYNRVVTERHRVIITPSTATGEYMADLLPVRYKVVEVSAEGHPSLLQKGKVSEIIDLTDSLTTKQVSFEGRSVDYRATYNRIYRCEPTVDIVEVDAKTGTPLPHVGLATYTESALTAGQTIDVPLYDAKTGSYTIGYPVLPVGKHDFMIRATENYYYNGLQTGICDSVPLRGGQARVYDDFAAVQHDTLCVLNTHNGTAFISVDVQNTVYDVTGANALRHLNVTLEYEGQFIDGRSLNAFVLGSDQVMGDIMSADGMIQLVDVLRDPPGSRSYSWIDNQTNYHSDFNFNIGIDAAIKLGFETGSRGDLMLGAYAGSPTGGTWTGSMTRAYTTFQIPATTIPLIGYHHTYNGSIDFQLNERIQTSDDPDFVGDDADIYYGYELVAATTVMRNVRAVNHVTYEYLKTLGLFNAEDGSCHLIAEGKAANNTPYYLISDYDYFTGPKVKSNFLYTQHYILYTLIPKLKMMRNNYLYKGTREEAQARADATLQNVLFSLRSEDDPRYGQDNRDDSLDYISIDRYDEFRDRLNYEIITPMYVRKLGLEKQMAGVAEATDSVRIMNRQIAQWEYIVASNEVEKFLAFQSIDDDQKKRGSIDYDNGSPYDSKNKNYYAENRTITGGTKFSHDEYFTSKAKHDNQVPILGFDVTDFSSEQGTQYFNKVINGYFNVAEGAANSAAATEAKKVGLAKKYSSSEQSVTMIAGNNQKTLSGSDLRNSSELASFAETVSSLREAGTDVSISASSTYTKVTIVPVVDATWQIDGDESESTTTYRGYQLQTDADSYLNVDVYHDVKTVASGINVFGVNSTERTLSQGNYIFRTMGGATKCPYDRGSVTQMFAPGSQLSHPTAQVEKPRITVENHILSGVPYGEKAKFNLVLSNEGTVRREGSFDLVLLDHTNQTGASLSIDGAPLGSGRSLVVPFGTGMVKVLEVGQGLTDDYENIRLALRSQCDPSVADTVALSVHFVPTASPIAVITPPDKWLLNTNSAQDERGRYYMPVSIGGYDVNFRNFDHIELQYKQSNEPESRWTSLCSYYANDSLYQTASGIKSMLVGNTITHAFYGDSDPVELQYDLRAVTYSRLGNDYVTRQSPVFSGIKDTRRPELFGSPLPANSILGVGDDLKLMFSEPINANRLLATNNFRVTGLPTGSTVVTSTAPVFDGTGSMTSEAERNFNGKDLMIDVMIRPDFSKFTGEMSIFRHESPTGWMNFTVSNTGRLKLTVYDGKYNKTSETSATIPDDVNWNMYQRVLVSYYHNGSVTFYLNNAELHDELHYNSLPKYSAGSGHITFGQGFVGNMLEARVWTKYLYPAGIAETAGRTLYGYESGLCAYYPMNEGRGDEVEDKAQGATLKLNNVAWSLPEGMALKFGNHRPDAVCLNSNVFEQTMRMAKSFTLTLWFNADGSNPAEVGLMGPGQDQFNIRLIDGKVTLSDAMPGNANYFVMQSDKDYRDGLWHHLAFSVDYQRNQAVLYVDGEQAAIMPTEKIGSLFYNNIYVGTQHDKNGKLTDDGRFKGYIDEITLWDMALSQNLIRQKMNHACDGSELGLVAYIPFNKQVQQVSGGGTLQEFTSDYYYSRWDTEQQKYVSATGNPFARFNVTNDMKSADVFAPVKEKDKVRNLRFSYVTKDNELIISVNELPKDIERTNVTVHAMGIEDLNGNEMAQPVEWQAFIHRNTVRWEKSKKTVDIDAVKDTDDYTFSVNLNNHGGKQRTYVVEGLPAWMTIEQGTEGSLSPEEEQTLDITILKDLNIGTYDVVLYLKTDEELVDPLALTVRKVGTAPDWAVDKGKLKNMQICAQVRMAGNIVDNKDNVFAAFDEFGNCVGKTSVTISPQGKPMVYLTVYPREATSEPLTFRMWNAADGITYRLRPGTDIVYKADEIHGSYEDPVQMTATLEITQELALNDTWSWVSLNVASPLAGDINRLLKKGLWSNGDQLKDPEEQTFYTYSLGKWTSNRKDGTSALRNDRMYYLLSHKQQTVQVDGTPMISEDERRITLHDGWNYIGYTPMVNLPVNEALTDFYSKAVPGDIVKSQHEFATFTKDFGWQGNLLYMKPGEGYMLRHKAKTVDETVSFVYPFKNPSDVAVASARAAEPLWANSRQTSMTMVVSTAGVEAQEGDRLMVYADGELSGIAEAVVLNGRPMFFVSTGGEQRQPLSFTLERDGELLGSAPQALAYQPHGMEGTTDVPKVITFNDLSAYESGVYYTVGGLKVGERRPAKKGVYIYNNEKVVVK